MGVYCTSTEKGKTGGVLAKIFAHWFLAALVRMHDLPAQGVSHTCANRRDAGDEDRWDPEEKVVCVRADRIERAARRDERITRATKSISDIEEDHLQDSEGPVDNVNEEEDTQAHDVLLAGTVDATGCDTEQEENREDPKDDCDGVGGGARLRGPRDSNKIWNS